MPRPEHPLVVALVEQYARAIRVEPAELWSWLDGEAKPPPDVLRGLVNAFYPTVRPSDFGKRLTSPRTHSTLSTVRQADTANAQRSRALLSEDISESKAGRHIVTRGFTFVELSDYLESALGRKVPHGTVRAWFRKPSSPLYRIIPTEAQKALEKKPYEFPRDVWPKVRGE